MPEMSSDSFRNGRMGGRLEGESPEGLDHRDFKVRISSRHTRRRRGTHFRKWNHKSEKHQHYIIIYEKSCKTLGILLKVFRHELLHSRGIDHRDMLDDFNDNGLCEENSASS